MQIKFFTGENGGCVFQVDAEEGKEKKSSNYSSYALLKNSSNKEQNKSVIVDTKLNGLVHVAYIKEIIVNYARCVYFLSRRDWGLHGEVLTIIYKIGLD